MTAPSTPAEHDAGTINARRPQSPVAGRVEGMSFRPDARFWVVYGCLMTVQLLSAMYQTAVTTALPTVIGDLGDVAHMSWAITAYTLGQTLAMPVTGKLDLKALAAAAGGKRAVMADAALAERRTGYVVGGISPLGQKKRLPTVVDASVEGAEHVLVSGGRRGMSVRVAPADLVAVTGGSFAALTV